MSPSQALAIVPQPAASAALAPRTIAEVSTLAEIAAKSGLYGVKSREDAFVRILTGLELGLSAMQSLRGVYVINGRPTLAADLMVGVCKKKTEVCKYFRLVESNDKVATYETERVGEGVTRMAYTIDQAKRAKLTGKDTWVGHTEAMLRARASSLLARAVYSDLLNGLYDPDEVDHLQAQPVRVAVSVREPSPAQLVEVSQAEDSDDEEAMRAAYEEQLAKAAKLDEALDAAKTPAQLEEVRMQIKESGLPETFLAPLRDKYKKRSAELAPLKKGSAPQAAAPVVPDEDPETAALRASLLAELVAPTASEVTCGRVIAKAAERAEEGLLSSDDVAFITQKAKEREEELRRAKHWDQDGRAGQ